MPKFVRRGEPRRGHVGVARRHVQETGLEDGGGLRHREAEQRNERQHDALMGAEGVKSDQSQGQGELVDYAGQFDSR